MSKVKQYYTDETEKKVDDILLKVKNKSMTKDNAKVEILKLDNLGLVDISEDNIDEVIELEVA
jgi:Ribonuclease G/E